MAESVVNLLEVINIHKQERERGAFSHAKFMLFEQCISEVPSIEKVS